MFDLTAHIKKYVDETAQVITLCSTPNFAMKIDSFKNTGGGKAFVEKLMHIVGRTDIVFTEQDKNSIASVLEECVVSGEDGKEYKYFNVDKDKHLKAIYMHLNVHIQKDQVAIKGKIVFAMVDLSKEWLWIKWKMENIIAGVIKQYDILNFPRDIEMKTYD